MIFGTHKRGRDMDVGAALDNGVREHSCAWIKALATCPPGYLPLTSYECLTQYCDRRCMESARKIGEYRRIDARRYGVTS